MLKPFCHKSGTPESGQKWSDVAENLNTHPDFAEMPRDQRSVRERFNKRFKDFKAKLAKEEKASGINVPPPTEVDSNGGDKRAYGFPCACSKQKSRL